MIFIFKCVRSIIQNLPNETDAFVTRITMLTASRYRLNSSFNPAAKDSSLYIKNKMIKETKFKTMNVTTFITVSKSYEYLQHICQGLITFRYPSSHVGHQTLQVNIKRNHIFFLSLATKNHDLGLGKYAPLRGTAPQTNFVNVCVFFSKITTHWKKVRYVSCR